MQSHYSVGFEDRGKDREPRNVSCATIEVEKLSASGRSAALPTPRFRASESNFRLLTSRKVRGKMSTVLTHCACMLRHFRRVQLFATPEEPTRLLCLWDSPGKNTGVGCHALLQGIFPTQGLNPHLLHIGRWVLYYSHLLGSPLKMAPPTSCRPAQDICG